MLSEGEAFTAGFQEAPLKVSGRPGLENILLFSFLEAKVSQSSPQNPGNKVVLFQNALQYQRLPFTPLLPAEVINIQVGAV